MNFEKIMRKYCARAQEGTWRRFHQSDKLRNEIAAVTLANANTCHRYSSRMRLRLPYRCTYGELRLRLKKEIKRAHPSRND